MINKFFLGNFKAFGRTQEIPIKPLTLIFGPNSSGKSSIIQGLLLFNEMISKKSLDVTKIDTGQETIDVGEFEQYVHGQGGDKFVTFGAEWNEQRCDEAFLKPFAGELLVDGKFRVSVSFEIISFARDGDGYLTSVAEDIAHHITNVYAWEFKIGNLIEFSICRDEHWKLNEYNFDHPLFDDLNALCASMDGDNQDMSNPAVEDSQKVWDFLCENVRFMMDEPFTSDLKRIGVFYLPGFGPGISMFDTLRRDAELAGVNPDQLLCLAQFIVDSIKFVFGEPGKLYFNNSVGEKFGSLGRFNHIGPWRKIPSRTSRIPAEMEMPGMRFDDVWKRLASSQGMRDCLNSWLGDKNLLATRYELVFHKIASPIGPIEGMLLLKDKRTGALVGNEDVGVGISQVIPVLMAAFGGDPYSAYCIEQPELHLHPKLQADLMDVFIRSACGQDENMQLTHGRSLDSQAREGLNYLGKGSEEELNEAEEAAQGKVQAGTYPWGGPHFILETHSEALILRLMKRMRQTANGTLPDGMPGVTPENVAILYVEPHEHGSIVHELELADDGTLLDPWPGGFFEESFEERFGE